MHSEALAADFVQTFQLETPRLRGRLVRLGPIVNKTLADHGYPQPVAALLAESLALAAVLASGLKYDGVFTLQIQGDGPLGLIVVDVTSDGDMRGYARVARERLDRPPNQATASVPRLLGFGHLAFTVDQGPGSERYQGIAPLEGASLSECAHAYFRRSEQIETAIRLNASVAGGQRQDDAAAALMLQRLPVRGAGAADADDEDENWRRSVTLLSSVKPGELLSSALSPSDLLFRLFHEEGVRVFPPRPLRYRCRCSRGKVIRLLATFPRAEVEAMAEDGRITVTCEFCKQAYALGVDEIDGGPG